MKKKTIKNIVLAIILLVGLLILLAIGLHIDSLPVIVYIITCVAGIINNILD